MTRNGVPQTVRALLLVAALSALASSARADPVDDLKAQVDTLTKRVELLERKLQVAELAQSAAAAADRDKGTPSRLPFGYGFQFLESPRH